MANPNKAKGSAFELDIERALQAEGINAKRPRQTGNQDVGDLHVSDDWTLQAKNWANLATAVKAGTEGAERQSAHSGRPFFAAIIKKRGANVREAYVVLPLRVFAQVLKKLGTGGS